MEIANFKYKDKEYIFVLEDNEIKYGYKENGELNTNLTKEEDDMMKYIMSKIFISSNLKNHYKYGKTIHNGKLFQVMYDEISEKKFFYEIVNNGYKFPKLEDNIYLYEKFNSYVDYFANKEKKEVKEKTEETSKKKKRFNTKVFWLGIDIIIWSSLICFFIRNPNELGQTIDKSKFLSKYGYYKVMDFVLDEQVKVENLEKALQENENLIEEEKDEFRKFYTMVEENKEYINSYMISGTLRKYSIKYSSNERIDSCGDNDRFKECINIYGKGSYEETIKDDLYKRVLSHEICHTFQDLFIHGGLSEAINEAFNAEYVTKNPIEYYGERMCLYSLCEIVNPNCFRSYRFEGDKKPLIKELQALVDDKALEYELIGNIDSYTENEIEKNKCETEEEKKKIDELQYELKNKIYDSISDYFYAKYSYPIEEDNIMMAYLCNSGFLPEKNIYNKNMDDREGYTTTNVFPKGYFSEEYKKEHTCVLLEQTNKKDNMKHGLKVKNVNREEFLKKYQEKLENKGIKKR